MDNELPPYPSVIPTRAKRSGRTCFCSGRTECPRLGPKSFILKLNEIRFLCCNPASPQRVGSHTPSRRQIYFPSLRHAGCNRAWDNKIRELFHGRGLCQHVGLPEDLGSDLAEKRFGNRNRGRGSEAPRSRLAVGLRQLRFDHAHAKRHFSGTGFHQRVNWR